MSAATYEAGQRVPAMPFTVTRPNVAFDAAVTYNALPFRQSQEFSPQIHDALKRHALSTLSHLGYAHEARTVASQLLDRHPYVLKEWLDHEVIGPKAKYDNVAGHELQVGAVTGTVLRLMGAEPHRVLAGEYYGLTHDNDKPRQLDTTSNGHTTVVNGTTIVEVHGDRYNAIEMDIHRYDPRRVTGMDWRDFTPLEWNSTPDDNTWGPEEYALRYADSIVGFCADKKDRIQYWPTRMLDLQRRRNSTDKAGEKLYGKPTFTRLEELMRDDIEPTLYEAIIQNNPHYELQYPGGPSRLTDIIVDATFSNPELYGNGLNHLPQPKF